MLPFDKSEYLKRLEKVKGSMISKGIEVLLVADPASMCYLSGYNAYSFYTPQLLIVMLDAEQPVWVGRYQDVQCAKATTWIDSDNIIGFSDDHLWEPAIKHGMDFVAGLLREKGLAGKTIGVEMDAYYFTAYWYERLKKGLPDARFKDATLLVNWVRTVKSDREIEYMRKGARIVEKAMQSAIDTVGQGVRECDVAAGIYQSLLTGTEEYGGDYPSIVPLMPVGKNSGAPHLTWTDARYQKGQVLYIEIAGVYNRYHAPLTRTIVIGDPSPKVKDTAEIVLEGLNEAMDSIRPGGTCEQVQAAWNRVISRYGLNKESRMGYSIGLSYPPVWLDNTAFFRPGDKTVLEPNMTFHIMPGMWFDDFGIAITESVRVTESGCESLTQFPRQLFVK